MYRRLTGFLLWTLLTCGVCSTPGFAQQPPQPPPAEADEQERPKYEESVIVSASKVEQALERSKQGTSMPSAFATLEASAGMQVSGEQPPAMTMPMSEGWSPARSSATSAARLPVSPFV